MQVNMVALTHLTKLFLPQIRAREGKLLNVASTAAFQPGPFMAVYYASKAYVLHFTEALAEELRDTGVTVTCLCPGPVKTNFQKRAHLGDTQIGDQSPAGGRARGGARGLRRHEAGQARRHSGMEEPVWRANAALVAARDGDQGGAEDSGERKATSN